MALGICFILEISRISDFEDLEDFEVRVKTSKSSKIWPSQNYTLEWFSEAGSARIRSAVKFYFDIDVRIFFPFVFKKIFSIDKKNHRKKMNIFKFTRFWNFRFLRFWNFDFSDFFNFCRELSIFQKIVCSFEKKYFLEKVGKKSGHQYRSKISMRIEWEHSQLLKTALKHGIPSVLWKRTFLGVNREGKVTVKWR